MYAKTELFGRRLENVKGWIIVQGKPRISCVITNLSKAGAFLELDDLPWLPYQFSLLVEGQDKPFACEFRHKRANGISVIFSEQRLAQANPAQPVINTDQWTGSFKFSRTPARSSW